MFTDKHIYSVVWNQSHNILPNTLPPPPPVRVWGADARIFMDAFKLYSAYLYPYWDYQIVVASGYTYYAF